VKLRNKYRPTAIVGLLIILFVGYRELHWFSNETFGENAPCPINEKTYTVRGESMRPLLKEGQGITGLLGYYACHEVKRGDIILYEPPGKENVIVKKVVGTPGDSFAIEKNGTSPDWNIVINGSLLTNSAGVAYALDEQKHKILALYERDYTGNIPEGAYILLGDAPAGSLDSTQFGLAQKSRIMGKVEPQ